MNRFVDALIADEKAKAEVLSICEIARAAERSAFRDRILKGPVARSGARSHASWRKILAQRALCAMVLHVVASRKYDEAAGLARNLTAQPSPTERLLVSFAHPGSDEGREITND